MKPKLINLAVFASGQGSNFSAIAKAVKQGRIKAQLKVLVCDNPQAPVVKRAQVARVQVVLVQREDFSSRLEFEAAIIQKLNNYKIDLIVLAGFMRLLSPVFVKRYRNRIMNIHPSLLPVFKGAHAIKDAFDSKAKVTGVTVHFVDEKVDHGPVILQQRIRVGEKDTLISLEKRIHSVEHKLYPKAIKLVIANKIKSSRLN
ncbi:MAG: phosphoribosylglycinamide formyltransferase [Candidatus Omnitrophica bacterium]|nr:phosphoribosylglycinamide formyltransferase [Candidatus Omnitrophota bacterium]